MPDARASAAPTAAMNAGPRWRRHWPEYALEALGLGLFMISAATCGVLLESAGSPLRQALPDPFVRRFVMGICMGITGAALVYSPLGQRSGAHLNPAVTLTFLRLGRVAPPDAAGYVLAQFAGGAAGLLVAATVLGAPLADAPVRHVTTVPGAAGPGVAFAAEFIISFLLMSAVLLASNDRRWHRATGLVAGTLVAIWITFEAPLSGMSMNPARTFGSALGAGLWTHFWIYLTAPLLGMLAAAELQRRLPGIPAARCAKLHHENRHRCIFRCAFRHPMHDETSNPTEKETSR